MLRPRLLSLMVAAACTLALGACGNDAEHELHGETEGAYLHVGELTYQVQISRLLNPDDREDESLLVGVPNAEDLDARDSWFAVFLRAENETGEPQPLADEYVIRDSQENEFLPVEIAEDNVFAMHPGEVPAGEVYPLPSSAAAETTIQGSMLLFKVPFASLENRPLDLHITSPSDPEVVGSVELDV